MTRTEALALAKKAHVHICESDLAALPIGDLTMTEALERLISLARSTLTDEELASMARERGMVLAAGGLRQKNKLVIGEIGTSDFCIKANL